MNGFGSTRRTLVVGTVLAGLTSSRLLGAVARPRTDPRHCAEGQIKMLASLDGAPGVWAYSGIIYAVRPGERPKPILSIDSGNSNWGSPQADGSWSLAGSLVSLFRDPLSEAYLDYFDNPFTGKRNVVHPNSIHGGFGIIPKDGQSIRLVGTPKASASEPKGFHAGDPSRPLGRVEWIETHSTIALVTDVAFDVPKQPQLEARTIFADKAAFYQPRITRLPARFVTTTISPWLSWMEMGMSQAIWFGTRPVKRDSRRCSFHANSGQGRAASCRHWSISRIESDRFDFRYRQQ